MHVSAINSGDTDYLSRLILFVGLFTKFSMLLLLSARVSDVLISVRDIY